ncbi:MAG TPA: DUF5998 family protein [Nocardioidaceae bacterium]|nr:DUF5998 family protein [Nocardioidaceae bacterium]
MGSPTVADRSTALRTAIDRVGYYPQVVSDAVDDALAGEPVRDFVIHHEPTFDYDEVRRHITVLVLTPTRLVVTHTDEHPADELLPAAYTSTTTEAVPIGRVGSVAVTRMVAEPGAGRGRRAAPGVAEAVLTVGWGAVSRVDLEPATCDDPDCDGDHGYTGTLSSDDFTLRFSDTADGPGAVDALLAFARTLSAATTGG